jgi:hypothetical protein
MQKVLDGGVNVQTGVPFDIAKVNDNLAIDWEEHFGFQKAQSEAFASGHISYGVAQLIYAALGEVHASTNGGWQQGVTTARKQSITQLISELLAKQHSVKA